MTQLSTQEIMLAAALVFGLSTACQVIAPHLRVPSLVLLLPVGFIFGLLAPAFRFDEILGSAFPVAVDLMVAVILFQGGMELAALPLRGKDKAVVRKLVWIGAPITWVAGSIAAHYILGFEWKLAAILGAFLIVSGPTVVAPILDVVRPNSRVREILTWEGTLLDPLGAIFAVMLFQIVKASNESTFETAVQYFLGGLLTATIAAIFGVFLFIAGGRLVKNYPKLGTQVLLGSVLLAAGLADSVNDDSGLLTALLMGVTAPRLAKKYGASLDGAKPFFNTIVTMGIGVLFITIAALVPSPTFTSLLLPTFLVVIILLFIVRPTVVAIGTTRSGIARNDRIFMGWMYPRGIVAAATAASIGTALIALKIPGAENLLPAAFIIITVTVTVYGLTATPLARKLKIRDSSGEANATQS
jgi:NhaP-type Na+/H+ or K+/H+ antiporter